jgi:putative ATP-binding cassette transporter
MQLICALFRRAPRELLHLAVLGAIGGGSSAALLWVLQRLVVANQVGPWLVALFAATVAARIVSSIGASLLLARFSQNIILQLLRDMVSQVLRAPFEKIEGIGTSRILASMTDDVPTLAALVLRIPALTVNISVLAGCALYLGWLSPLGLGATVILGVGGGFVYRAIIRRAQTAIRAMRDGRDRLFGVLRSVTDGIKELQLHQGRREAFLREEVDEVMELLKHQNIAVMRHDALADAWTQLVFYAVLAVVLFGLGSQGVPRETITAYIFAAIYCMSPVWSIVGTFPMIERGKAAWERVQELGVSLARETAPVAAVGTLASTCPRITFEAVQYTYAKDDAEHGFTLGPIDFTLEPGELIFIVGGNGSGKSTLVKLLAGLYQPRSGRILVNDEPMSAETSEAYRELFSVVFSDFYLFERLHGFSGDDLREQANRYLRKLNLDHKLSIVDNRLSSISLSTGQRRRLALLTAYLENRQIYILDEWAADQDPHYRSVFYSEILPELKRLGKTVIVITHDDRYFHVADRILKLDFGRVVSLEDNETRLNDKGSIASCA